MVGGEEYSLLCQLDANVLGFFRGLEGNPAPLLCLGWTTEVHHPPLSFMSPGPSSVPGDTMAPIGIPINHLVC